MPNTGQITNLPESAPSYAVVVERLRVLADSVDSIRDSLQHMATKEQVAQLASRADVEKLQWQIDALKTDVEKNSVAAVWKNLTTIVAGLSGIIALIVALTGWKPGP